jgi:hypothetical protein
MVGNGWTPLAMVGRLDGWKRKMPFPKSKKEKMKTRQLKMVDQVGKKHCTCFVEISQAPPQPVHESDLQQTVFNIIWEDGSKGNYQCIDLIRVSLQNLTSLTTFLSHGLESFDFVKAWLDKYPKQELTTEMAIYFYKKINE